MRDAAEYEAKAQCEHIQTVGKIIAERVAMLVPHQKQYPNAFPDAEQLIAYSDRFAETINERIEGIKAAETKAAEAEKAELELRRQQDAEKKAESPQDAAEPGPARELPKVAENVTPTPEAPDVVLEAYQINIIVTRPMDEAKALAKAINERYGAVIANIQLLKLKDQAAA